MKKTFLLFLYSIFSLSTYSVNRYSTQIFNENIKTLEIGIRNENYVLPIIEINGNDILEVRFDEMSHEAHSFGYKVLHCNADWTLSNLNSNEYLEGFTTGNITDYTLSVNTTFLYTHYSFNLPNYDMKFKISGNYLVQIYEDNATDKPIAQACFSVVDPKVRIMATVRGNTDNELNGRYQQLDFDILMDGYQVRDPLSEIKTVIRQNNRIDNEVRNLTPTFISNTKLNYVNNSELIFEGGNEYHRFDISSVYAASQGVDEIKYQQPHYEVFLSDNTINTNTSYSHDFDVNGKFLINFQESVENSDIEGDYMYVHFSLPTNKPFFDGIIYLGGEFNYNLLNSTSRMKYDAKTEKYFQTLLLKQGGYNYQYWFLQKNSTKASTDKVEGNHWQTGNEYTIYVYNRPWGERYDKLIGILSIESNK